MAPERYEYTIVPGFFVYDTEGADALTNVLGRGEQILQDFGLLDTSADRWEEFRRRIATLRNEAGEGSQYKVIFIGRHGEGYHNLAMATKPYCDNWLSHWALLDGDGDFVWGPDPDLTEKGIDQAQYMNQFWKTQIEAGTPLPTQLYSSPFIRAARTCQITFSDILIENGKQRPLILEELREVMGLYPYDKRGRIAHLRAEFPNFDIGEGLEEDDVLWRSDYRETREEHAIRESHAFDIIFNSKNKEHSYVSITVHNGTIGAILLLLRRTRFIIPTGGAFALVIKAVKISV